MSADDDTAAFDQDRKEWSTAADPFATTTLCRYFDVAPSDVYECETLVDGRHDPDALGSREMLDYAGIDRLVQTAGKIVSVAQRFRPPDRHRDVDLSLRVDNGVAGRASELGKWRQAYRDRLGVIPDVIAFGVGDPTLGVFQRVDLIDTRKMLDALAAGILDGDRHEKRDGTAALYLATDDLERANAVLATETRVEPPAAAGLRGGSGD